MPIKSPEDLNNKLGFIFHAMLALPLAVFVYLFLEIKNRDLEPALADEGLIAVLLILLPIVGTAIMLGGYFLFKRDLKTLSSFITLPEKLSAYYGMSIKFYMSIALAAIIFVGGLYLTTSAIFIFGYVLLLFLMSLNRPTPQKFASDIPLSDGEREVIMNKGSYDDLKSTNREEN